MKRSIFSKIFFGYFFIILFLTSLLLFFSLRIIQTYHIDSLTAQLTHIAEVLEPRVQPLIEQKKTDQLNTLIRDISPAINTRITVIDNDGVVLADSEEDPKTMENHKYRPEIQTAYDGAIGTSLRYSTTVGERMLYVALPIGEGQAVLRVSLFVRDIKELLSYLKRNLFIIACGTIILALVIAWFIARSMSKPIWELTQKSQKIASGEFNQKVYIDKPNELNILAQNFNRMASYVKESFADMSRQKEELKMIVSSINEGLIVIDEEKRISVWNESFKQIVGADISEPQYYWEVVREPYFNDMMEEAYKNKENIVREITFNERVFLCSATCLSVRNAIIVLFLDISEIKNIETIKKDFVVNVSHELRTPLTAIKGFVETVESSVSGDNKRYIEIIKRHAERLIRIVEDLLMLAKLESQEEKEIQISESVDIAAVMDTVVKIFEPRFSEKKLQLHCNFGTIIPRIKGDSFQLEQLFINLVDNAIKYTEEGSITISIASNDSQLTVEIKDTGIGIAQEHIKRICERFYVADKSRSKKMGGTGLGLSIVKHILLLHNASFDIKSTPGSGSSFTVVFPVSPFSS